MRIPSVHQRETERDDDSFITPMIDVVFLLLIFFVCASVGQVQESLLPTPLSAGSVESAAAVEAPTPLGNVWVKLTRTERRPGEETTRAELNDRLYDDWTSLRATLTELAEVAPEIPVILDIASGVPVGDFVDIYDTCRAAGFNTVNFATEAPH